MGGATAVADPRAPFTAHVVRGTRSKTELRQFVAEQARSWATLQHRNGVRGAIMLDIDDTLIDGRDRVVNGFQYMRDLYSELSLLYPIHIVTARPRSDHAEVMRLLSRLGFAIPADRLHMLPTRLYGKSYKYVEDFKFECYKTIKDTHGNVVLRMGDKMWDVAHINTLRGGPLSHVQDASCYVFMDPQMAPCLSCKLPGGN